MCLTLTYVHALVLRPDAAAAVKTIWPWVAGASRDRERNIDGVQLRLLRLGKKRMNSEERRGADVAAAVQRPTQRTSRLHEGQGAPCDTWTVCIHTHSVVCLLCSCPPPPRSVCVRLWTWGEGAGNNGQSESARQLIRLIRLLPCCRVRVGTRSTALLSIKLTNWLLLKKKKKKHLCRSNHSMWCIF